MSLVAMVMAGGRGERLAATHADRPKPLVCVAGAPLIDLAVARVVAAGVAELHFALGHDATRLRRHVEERWSSPERTLVFHVEAAPRGQVGALVELRDRAETVVVVNADVVTSFDLAAFAAAHARSGVRLSIATHEESAQSAFGEVISDERDRVVAYVEKPRRSWTISSGIYLVERDVRELVSPRAPLGADGLVKLALEAGLAVRSHFHDAPWIDVNDATSLRIAEALVANHSTAFAAALARNSRS